MKCQKTVIQFKTLSGTQNEIAKPDPWSCRGGRSLRWDPNKKVPAWVPIAGGAVPKISTDVSRLAMDKGQRWLASVYFASEEFDNLVKSARRNSHRCSVSDGCCLTVLQHG
jgi:hypothetical protein